MPELWVSACFALTFALTRVVGLGLLLAHLVASWQSVRTLLSPGCAAAATPLWLSELLIGWVRTTSSRGTLALRGLQRMSIAPGATCTPFRCTPPPTHVAQTCLLRPALLRRLQLSYLGGLPAMYCLNLFWFSKIVDAVRRTLSKDGKGKAE